jgi:2-C-methyl-D-erythritol 4-phosphate cytidylyltransferase
MKKSVIITGGGLGTRMNMPLPKQFIVVKDKPVIVHTINLFRDYDADMEIVVVLPADFLKNWEEISAKYYPNITIHLVSGGATRFHSVKNALARLDENLLIGVHDAVRPLVSPDVIARCYTTAEKSGNAIPAIPLAESIRKVENDISYPIDRSNLHIIQTPQVFHGALLKKAYQSSYLPEFTDDASVVEKLGVKINLVEGNRSNIKITTKEDLEML